MGLNEWTICASFRLNANRPVVPALGSDMQARDARDETPTIIPRGRDGSQREARTRARRWPSLGACDQRPVDVNRGQRLLHSLRHALAVHARALRTARAGVEVAPQLGPFVLERQAAIARPGAALGREYGNGGLLNAAR